MSNPFDAFNTPDSSVLFPVDIRRVGWETSDGEYQRTTGHKAIVRLTEDNAHLLTIVGASYKLIHNGELFSLVEDAMIKQMPPEHLEGVRVADSVSGYGRMCYREYIFPAIKCRIADTRSDIAFRIIVQNGYGGSALRIHSGAIDFFCLNGIIRGEFQSAYRKHTSGLVITGIGNMISQSLVTFADSQDLWKRWASTPVPHQAAMDLFRELASTDRLRENLQHQYLREADAHGQNLWAAYSALTYYASHSDGEFKLRSTVEHQDTVAATMLQRELTVARWVESDAWRRLEYA